MNNDKDDWYYETMFGSPGKSNNYLCYVPEFCSVHFWYSRSSILYVQGSAGYGLYHA